MRRLSHACGPPLEAGQCRRVDDKLVRVFVERGHGFYAAQVGAMAEFGLCVTAHEPPLRVGVGGGGEGEGWG